jgi:septal ring factor EnvC (AmiA/AmiB activator)
MSFYFQELEQIEETWREESKDLLTMVAKLQEENRRLNSALSESEKAAAKYESKFIKAQPLNHEADTLPLHHLIQSRLKPSPRAVQGWVYLLVIL